MDLRRAGAVFAVFAVLGLVHCSANTNLKNTGTSADAGAGGGTASGNPSGNGGATNGTGSGMGGGISTVGSTGSGGSEECDAMEKSSSGCDYYAVMPDIGFDATGGCFAAFVVNPGKSDVTVKVEYGGQMLDASKFGYIPKGNGAAIKYTPLTNAVLPGGQVAILFLNRFGVSPLGLNTDCPPGIVPAINNFDAATHGTAIGKAFHLSTNRRVVAYDIYPYGGGQSALTSATLLLPTHAWGDNYVAVSPMGNGFGFGAFGKFPVLDIVAHQDNTTVTISPTVAIVGGANVAATGKGVPKTYTLQRGQVLQFTQPEALDGSAIKSNVPVGMWAGMTAFGVKACCDESAHQQIPPVRALGSEYVGVRYRNRYDNKGEESVPWRIVGAIAGTKLTWEPSTPAGAPTSLAAGQVALFEAPGPFVVKSQDAQHPFYLAAYMTGGAVYDPAQQMPPTGGDDGRGDAEYVNVVPPGEYLNHYVFYTDPTYPETNLVLVRVKGATDFADVTLDCAGNIGGWQPLGNSGKYQYARIDLVRHNFQGQNGCDNGRREISSPQPFGLAVWGWGSAETGQQFKGFYTQYVSYAYPGGAGVEPINDVVIVPNPL
jgi:hypothetical protein